MIRRLKYSDINFEKYEACLEKSCQKNFYAQKKVLDFLSGNWELLVYKDYEAVMPVTLTKKFGVSFVQMPLFCQQLGVFSKTDTAELTEEFLKIFRKKYRIFYYSFNEVNQFKSLKDQRSNFIIEPQDFTALRKKYFKGRKSTVKTASYLDFSSTELDDETLEFIRKNMKGLNKASDQKLLLDYLKFLHHENLLQLYCVCENQKLLSLACLTNKNKKLSLLCLVNENSEKNKNAPSFLINEILRTQIASNQFDFMGSTIRGIAVFFKSFGAEDRPYYFVENQRIKSMLTLLKKLKK